MTRFSFATLALSALVATTTTTFPFSVSAWEPGSGNRVMWESNCDFKGKDITSVNALSEKCGDICADRSDCTHWTWVNDSGGKCWLKNGSTNTKSYGAGMGCGYVIGRFIPDSPPIITDPPIGTANMLNSINALRVNNGVAPLTIDVRLERAATGHSNDQASRCTMGHAGANGSRAPDRAKAQGYTGGYIGENVAGGQASVQDVMTAWANSAPHRANMLNANYVHVGFAKAVNNNCGNYKTYWTQVFGRP